MKKLLLFGSIVLCCVFGPNTSVFAQGLVDLYLDNINVYVAEYGKILIYSLPDTTLQIVRISPLVGTGSGTVYDAREDGDIEDSTTLVTNPLLSDFEIYGAYNNYYYGLPPNVLVKQNIYCWQNQNSIIAKYTVINRETNPIDAVFGFELIPEVEGVYEGEDTVTYNSQTKIISDRKTEAVGFKLLSGDINSLNIFMYFKDYNNDVDFWTWLTNGEIDTLFIIDPHVPQVDDPVIIPSFNSQNIAVGDSAIYYLAIGYGSNEVEMLASMEQAQQKYNQITSVESDLNNIPSDFVLEQNYPNPFNPTTKITFGLPEMSNVTLKIFNTLGEEVTELVNELLEAGTHSYNFDASKLTSGIYIYSLQTESGSISKKMTLIK